MKYENKAHTEVSSCAAGKVILDILNWRGQCR